jgi:hypothetical protein
VYVSFVWYCHVWDGTRGEIDGLYFGRLDLLALPLQTILITLKYKKYSAIVNLQTFHFTVAHALGFSVFASRLLATDLNAETSTVARVTHSKYYT